MSHVNHVTWVDFKTVALFFASVRGGVMSHICHTYEWVTSHVWMGRVTHVWMSHGNHVTWVDFKTVALFVPLFVDESCHVYATHMSESCQLHDMGELQDSSTFWNVREWDSPMWRDSFLCAAYMWHIYRLIHETLQKVTLNYSRTVALFVTFVDKSCHIYAAHMNDTSHVWMSRVTHIRMSQVTRMNESWHTYEWVRSHVWMSRVAHIWMSQVTRMNESCHTHMNESCQSYDMRGFKTAALHVTFVWMSHVTYMPHI